VNDVQTWLGVALGDYNRYPLASIIQALNAGQSRFTLLTECLTMPILIVVQNNIQHYRLPDFCQKILSARYYYGDDRMSYQELTIKGSARELQDEVLDFRGALGSPAYYLFPSYRGGVIQFGISMFPSTDGTTFNAANSGCVAFNPGTSWPGAVSRTALSATAGFIDSAGTDLTTLGLTAGLPIFNATQSLSGIITEIITTHASNDTIAAAMGGNWAASDTAVIPLPDWGLAIDIPAGVLWTISTLSTDGTQSMGTVGDITAFHDNMILDVVRKPMPVSANYLSMVPEIPADYIDAIVGWAVYTLGRSSYKGLIQQAKAGEGKQRFEDLATEFREMSPFADQSESAVQFFDYFS
jgi:hypothetical protein